MSVLFYVSTCGAACKCEKMDVSNLVGDERNRVQNFICASSEPGYDLRVSGACRRDAPRARFLERFAWKMCSNSVCDMPARGSSSLPHTLRTSHSESNGLRRHRHARADFQFQGHCSAWYTSHVVREHTGHSLP